MLAGAVLAVGAPLLGFGVFVMVMDSASGKSQAEVGLQRLSFPSEVAPALSWQVRGMDGRAVDGAELGNDVLFVSNWATWCGPCRREMPAIEELVAR